MVIYLPTGLIVYDDFWSILYDVNVRGFSHTHTHRVYDWKGKAEIDGDFDVGTRVGGSPSIPGYEPPPEKLIKICRKAQGYNAASYTP